MGKKKRPAYADPEPEPESPFAALRDQFPQEPEVEEPSPRPTSVPSSQQVARDPAAAVPALQGNTPVRVHRERKGRRGKTVSIITGIKSPRSGQQALLKLLKSKLGTGGTLQGDTIEVQGDHRERIVEILNDLGYRAKVAGG